MSENLGFLISGYIDKIGLQKLKQDLNYYKKISLNNSFYLIDLSSFNLNNFNYYENDFKDFDVKYIKPKSIAEFKKLVVNKKFKLILGDICRLSELLIFFLLKLFKVKLCIINNRGLVLQSKFKFKSFGSLRYLYLLKKFEIYLYKILVILQLAQKIDYYIDTSSDHIKKLNKGLLISFDRFFGVNLFSPYKKIYRINSKITDNFDYELSLNTKNSSLKRQITLVDSGYEHPDKKTYENLSQEDIKKNSKDYYDKLYFLLDELKIKLKFEIVFCKHPRSNYNNPNFELIEKSFRVTDKNTHDEILKSELVIFTGGSSLVNNAILSNKKILLLISKNQIFYKTHIDYLRKFIDLEVLDIDEFPEKVKLKTISVNEVFNKSNLKTKNYQNFVRNNLVFNKLEKSYEQVSNVIFND